MQDNKPWLCCSHVGLEAIVFLNNKPKKLHSEGRHLGYWMWGIGQHDSLPARSTR